MTSIDECAAIYDAVFSDRVSRAEDAAVRRLIRPYLDGRDVLDVGCGTGLALTMGEPASYVGIDASLPMIERARERWFGYALKPRFLVGRVEELSMIEWFDTITCLWAYPYFSDQAGILNRWYRALRPGGDAILVSWDERHTPELPIPCAAPPMSLVATVAETYGFQAWPLGGLSGRVRGRRIARCLPVSLAARLIETGAEAPQWVLRLHRPDTVAVARALPNPPERSRLGGRPVPFGRNRQWAGP